MSSANTWGKHFTVTSFGESHGEAMGVIIDGCPAGIKFNMELLMDNLARRRPGGDLVSARREDDVPRILSGVLEEKTLGSPIAIVVRNKDAKPHDYVDLPYRAGHADDVWKDKFGHSDPRGGGRASGRETIARVMAGSVAQMLLYEVIPKFSIVGFAAKIGPLSLIAKDKLALEKNKSLTPGTIDEFPARFPSASQSKAVIKLLAEAKVEGKSYGGVAEIWVDNMPRGLGQPVFHKLKADLAAAMMSVGATAAVEIGDGFESASAEGSEFHGKAAASAEGKAVYGGIRGGISTGEKIVIRVTFKPTASVMEVAKSGRHDPCIIPRAIPVLESMVQIVLADHLLWAAKDKIENIKRIFS